jgi:hypothetical protein
MNTAIPSQERGARRWVNIDDANRLWLRPVRGLCAYMVNPDPHEASVCWADLRTYQLHHLQLKAVRRVIEQRQVRLNATDAPIIAHTNEQGASIRIEKGRHRLQQELQSQFIPLLAYP